VAAVGTPDVDVDLHFLLAPGALVGTCHKRKSCLLGFSSCGFRGGSARAVNGTEGDTEGDRHWPFTARYAEVGRIDPDRVLEVLGPDVRAPLVLEVIPAFEAPDAVVLEDLVESVRSWREAIARSEYPVA